MTTLVTALLCLGCPHLLLCAMLADPVLQRVEPSALQMEDTSMRPFGDESDHELPSTAMSRADARHSAPRQGDTFDEAVRSRLPRDPQQPHRGPKRLQRPQPPPNSGETETADTLKDWSGQKDKAGGGVKRIQPERREQCDDDLDCRSSPSQVCVKRARETFGRCQCPYYRPVEVALKGGVVRCATVKGLLDECHVTEECAATNPHLRCVHNLCVCASPYELRDRNHCQPVCQRYTWEQHHRVPGTADIASPRHQLLFPPPIPTCKPPNEPATSADAARSSVD